MAGSRRILARLASGGVVVAGAVVGFKLVGLVGSGSAAGIPGLTQTMVYATEDGQGGLVPVAAKGVQIEDPRKPQRFLVWSQASFEGEINEDSVRTLLARGQAASLEHRLGDASRARFRQDIGDTEREIRALSRLVDSELARVKQALRERPERHIVIRTNPRTADPRWAEVQELDRMLQRSQTGRVTGEALSPRDSALIYFLIHWDEWPVLKRLQDRFHFTVQGRREAAARWVTDESSGGGWERSVTRVPPTHSVILSTGRTLRTDPAAPQRRMARGRNSSSGLPGRSEHMRRTLLLFLAAIACGFVGGLAVRPAPLYAHSPCVCNYTGSSFPISDNCVGYTTDSVSCNTIPGDETCSIAGFVTWTPYGTTCAVPGTGSFNGIYLDSSMSTALDFDPTQSFSQNPISDTEACPVPAANPGPQLSVGIGVKWYRYAGGGSCTCPNTNPVDSAFVAIGWTCNGG